MAEGDREGTLASLAEVAQELGVSTERVRQIEKRALRKLLFWAEEHGLTFADLAPDRPFAIDLGEDDTDHDQHQN